MVRVIEEDGVIETCVWVPPHFFCPQCQTCLFTLICKFVQYKFCSLKTILHPIIYPIRIQILKDQIVI